MDALNKEFNINSRF